MTEFATPCGTLRLTDAAGTALPFQITQEILPYQASVYDIVTGTRVPAQTEHQYTVKIPVSELTVGAEYTLYLEGDYAYAYGDSDERAIANMVTADGYSLSLGAQDFNDAEKDRQAEPLLRDGVQVGWKPPVQYDESRFRHTALYVLPDWSGYRFRLLDRSFAEIHFRLAWILHTVEFADAADYESAVTLWTII